MIVHMWFTFSVPRPMKFTTLIGESVVKKLISNKQESFKILLELARKRFFEEKKETFVIIRFSFRSISSKGFKEAISHSLAF